MYHDPGSGTIYAMKTHVACIVSHPRLWVYNRIPRWSPIFYQGDRLPMLRCISSPAPHNPDSASDSFFSMILALLFLLLFPDPFVTAIPLNSPLARSILTLNSTNDPWHCNALPSWTGRPDNPDNYRINSRYTLGYRPEDCFRAVNTFRNDVLRAHNMDYQWLALGAKAVPGIGQAIFTPRRYVWGMFSFPSVMPFILVLLFFLFLPNSSQRKTSKLRPSTQGAVL